MNQTNDMAHANPERFLAELLGAQGATLAVAESCTGGLLGGRITALAGSSAYFIGGVIAYHNAVKIRHLGVPETLLDRDGAVSAGVARAMATGVRQRFRTNYGLSITGIAGPGGGTPDKPVGTIWLGLADNAGADAKKLELSVGDRHTIREQAVVHALEWLCQRLADV